MKNRNNMFGVIRLGNGLRQLLRGLRRLSFLCVEIVNFVGVDGYSVLKRKDLRKASQYAEMGGLKL